MSDLPPIHLNLTVKILERGGNEGTEYIRKVVTHR